MVDLLQLKSFLKSINLPIKAGELAVLAHAAPTDIREFIAAIDPLEELVSTEDVITRAEAVNLLEEQKNYVPFYEAIELEED